MCIDMRQSPQMFLFHESFQEMYIGLQLIIKLLKYNGLSGLIIERNDKISWSFNEIKFQQNKQSVLTLA